ncbi:MAG: type II toxin-antitoxin system HicB family antitoxin [Ktedonobacterales bacterium]
MSAHTPPYSMLIEWSNLDDAYIVSFPELERANFLVNIHGATYMEAAQKGQEVLADLLTWANAEGKTLPAPALFDSHAYRPGETAETIARDSQNLLREIEEHSEAPSSSNASAG